MPKPPPKKEELPPIKNAKAIQSLNFTKDSEDAETPMISEKEDSK